ncbi:trafficking protein particle complex [Sarcoptes scabiei]|nr:trafficking protein particle complex [Sarcoptes scabiei]
MRERKEVLKMRETKLYFEFHVNNREYRGYYDQNEFIHCCMIYLRNQYSFLPKELLITRAKAIWNKKLAAERKSDYKPATKLSINLKKSTKVKRNVLRFEDGDDNDGKLRENINVDPINPSSSLIESAGSKPDIDDDRIDREFSAPPEFEMDSSKTRIEQSNSEIFEVSSIVGSKSSTNPLSFETSISMPLSLSVSIDEPWLIRTDREKISISKTSVHLPISDEPICDENQIIIDFPTMATKSPLTTTIEMIPRSSSDYSDFVSEKISICRQPVELELSEEI